MIDTHLTRRFGLLFPIIGSPEPGIADGRLAAATSKAGALGVIGAGPCDRDWIAAQFAIAAEISVACGLDSARLSKEPEMLDFVLSFQPRAIYLSGGDPRPFADTIRNQHCRLICEARSANEFDHILEAGAEVMVVRGGGRSETSSEETTFAMIPAASDYLYARDDEVSLVASGGVRDARGLAAMITLGADGVCLDRRLWSTVQGDLSDDAPGSSSSLLTEVCPVQTLLQTICSRAERILSHAPRKIVREPLPPKVIGTLEQGRILDNTTQTKRPESDTSGK